jgi:error-prone DNA polymerase
MGFYSPATLVQDAQRHGVSVKPIDVSVSDLRCRVETDERICIGLNYVSGITTVSAVRIVTQRAVRKFSSIHDFTRRTQLRKSELETLAKIGALNCLGEDVHRRDALWQVEKAWRSRGPLFENLEETHEPSPLNAMTPTERLDADYRGAGLTTGPHPLYYQRAQLNELGVVAAARLHALDNGRPVRVAGMVITRQRPMTAKGFVFLSLEDETGVSNVVVRPLMFQKHRSLWTSEPALLIDGVIQKQDGVIHIRAEDAMPLEMHNVAPASHDFH